VKYLAIILSLVFTLLSAKPCVDGNFQNSTQQTEIAASHGDHSHTADQCSPFCSCACCGIQIIHHVPQEFIEVNGAAITPAEPISHYKTRFVSDYFGSIWQPPQLS